MCKNLFFLSAATNNRYPFCFELCLAIVVGDGMFARFFALETNTGNSSGLY